MPTVQASQPVLFAVIAVNEKNSCKIAGTLLDQDGVAVPLASVSSLTLTLYDRATDGIINSRNAQDIKNANGGTLHATSGAFTLTLSALDNPIVTTSTAAQAIETHYALIQASWSGNGYWSGLAQINVRQVHRVP